jgi:hypothetical protein
MKPIALPRLSRIQKGLLNLRNSNSVSQNEGGITITKATAAPKAKTKKVVIKQRTNVVHGEKVVVLPPQLQTAVNDGILQVAKDNKIDLKCFAMSFAT